MIPDTTTRVVYVSLCGGAEGHHLIVPYVTADSALEALYWGKFCVAWGGAMSGEIDGASGFHWAWSVCHGATWALGTVLP